MFSIACGKSYAKTLAGSSNSTKNSNGRVLEGSERVVVGTRMRWRPEIVLKRETKTRDIDYEMDYVLGSVMFKSPVSINDRDLNPIYVTVSYETLSDTHKYDVYGGKIGYKVFPGIELGITKLMEKQLAENYSLTNYDIRFKASGNTEIKAELANTSSLFDEDLSFQRREVSARSLEISG